MPALPATCAGFFMPGILMTLLTRMAATASRLIAAYGFTTTLRRTAGTVHPTTGVDSRTTTDYTVTAVATAISLHQTDSTLILAGDRMYTLTDTVEPANGDKLLLGGTYWQIVAWQPRQVQAGNVAYAVQVRG